jgi:cytosine deaminase
MYPTPYFQKVAALLKKARMGVVSDPHTGPLHARVRELLAEKCLVCLGQDDISDAYYPFGRNNMLEVAFLASHLLWFTAASDLETLYDMVTNQAAQAMGIHDNRVQVGAPAHLVVLHQSSVLEALRYHEAPRYVISHGKLVDLARLQTVTA